MKNLTLPLYNLKGESVGSVKLEPSVFESKPNSDLIHQVVVTLNGNSRTAIANTKDRGDVSGSNKKPYRQKGTGNARVGSAQSPIWRGGGTTFGPTSERNFTKRLPTKMKHAAWRQVLSTKFNDNQIFAIDSLSDLTGKTKDWTKSVTALSSHIPTITKKTLVIDATKQDLADRSIRNVSNHAYQTVDTTTLVDLLNYPTLILSDAALTQLTAKLAQTKKAAV